MTLGESTRSIVMCFAACAAAFVLSACSTVGYYAQSVDGEISLLRARRPIPSVMVDKGVSPQLRVRLGEVLAIRTFASRVLHLPDNGSYRSYADLKRPFAVWNVFAAPEFSLAPKQWCYLVVGCMSYRGYFAPAAAKAYAEQMRQKGFDVYVGGAEAYSTLGWFDDPVLNTFVYAPRYQLAGLIFHELAHQKLYIHGDSRFDESFAVAVQREGVRRWLARYGTAAERKAAAAAARRNADFVALVRQTRKRLAAVYAGTASTAQKRAAKAAVFAWMRGRHRAMKAAWGGYTGYDRWFGSGLNNAKLLAVSTYEDLVPAFDALLRDNGGNLVAFYAAAARIGALPRAQRAARLAALSRAAPVVGSLGNGLADRGGPGSPARRHR